MQRARRSKTCPSTSTSCSTPASWESEKKETAPTIGSSIRACSRFAIRCAERSSASSPSWARCSRESRERGTDDEEAEDERQHGIDRSALEGGSSCAGGGCDRDRRRSWKRGRNRLARACGGDACDLRGRLLSALQGAGDRYVLA